MKVFRVELEFSNFHSEILEIEALSSIEAILIAVARSREVCSYDLESIEIKRV